MDDADPSLNGVLSAIEMTTLLNVSTAILGVAGFDGRLRWVNPAFSLALGLPREELLDTPYIDRVHPDDVHKVVELLDVLSSAETGPSVDVRVRHSDGSWRVFRTAASVIGDLIYFSGSDLTEEHQRASDLAQANGLLSLFGVGVAHDLRSMLSVIQGAVTQVIATVHSDELNKALLDALGGMLERSIAQAWIFIGALLAVTRGEPVDRVDVMLSELVQGATDDVARERAASGATITCDRDVPMVWVSPVLLRATLANLFSNSIRYCPAGTVARIEVSATRRDGIVTVSVTDNGAGVAVEDLAVIFEPFERRAPDGGKASEDGSLRQVPTGYGLGLALCRQVVLAHGGRVWATSEPGQGTTIAMELPAASPPV